MHQPNSKMVGTISESLEERFLKTIYECDTVDGAWIEKREDTGLVQ